MPFVVFDTPLGPCALCWSEAGVRAVQLPESTREATVGRLRARRGDPGDEQTVGAAPPWVREAVRRIAEHVGGKPQDLGRVPLDLDGVGPFQVRVYRALQRVPAGRTTTYGALAAEVGSPGAARAVGRAMATNPLPLLVPCHRVLAADGKEGGFTAHGGLATKATILSREGVTLRRQASLFDGERPLPFDASEALRRLTAADATLGRHIAKVGPLRLKLQASEGTFGALAESIVYQQLSGKAAATIFSRVRALYPGGRLDPARVLSTRADDLRVAGVSSGKLASLRDLANRAARGEIPTMAELAEMHDDAIVEALTAVRGVGLWTTQMLLIFRLGRPDVLPLADLGIKKGFARVFRRRRDAELPTPDEVARHGERWRPFRSVASWYLWRALDTPGP